MTFSLEVCASEGFECLIYVILQIIKQNQALFTLSEASHSKHLENPTLLTHIAWLQAAWA